MSTPDWLAVAQTAISACSERRIIRDSDGNPSRVAFRDGAAEEAARVASRSFSKEAGIQAISDVLEQYQYAAPLHVGTLRTS